VGGEFGGINSPAYLAKNPNSRIPTMEDEGFLLWESNSIVRYLSKKYDTGQLYPSDSKVCAIADQWMDWQQTSVGQFIVPIFWGLVKIPEKDRDIELIEASRIGMIELMQILDNHLADKRYVAGKNFTMGDIPLGIVVYRWLKLIKNRPKMVNLEKWYERLAKRPAFKVHVLGVPFVPN
jgi:glutathione S-transferase